MSKQLIWTNTTERTALQAAYTAAKTAVQGIVAGYATMGITALVAGDFSRLFNDTEALVFDKLTGGTLSVGGLPVDRTEALKLLAKPTGYVAFIASIDILRANALAGFGQPGGQGRMSFTLESISTLFTLNSSLVVNFSTVAQAQYDDAGKYYVESDKAKAVYAFLQDAAAAFYARGLDAYFPLGHYGEGNEIPNIIAAGMLRLDYPGTSFQVNVKELTSRYDRG